MTDLSRQLERLSPAKRALLQRMAVQGAPGGSGPEAIRPRPGSGPAPLSSAQQRFWLLDRMDPGKAFYTIPAVFHLRGQVDAAALQRAFGRVIARHEALRTAFREEGDGPVQVVLPPAAAPFAVAEIRAAGGGAAEARRRVREWLRLPFDLARGPLARALLARTGEEEWLFALAVHHIVSDGWSQGILLRELGALYVEETGGGAAALPAPALQYADFASWESEWLQGPEVEERLAYWKRRLAGAPPSLELPADRPRPAVQSFRGAKHLFRVPRELADALGALAQREGASPFMVLAAAFQALLGRLAGEEDIPVGVPVANRGRQEVEGTVGVFVNTLVLRGDLSGDPPFRTLLGRVREAALEAYAHQDLPFDRLVEALQPVRSLSRTPLYQVLFALQNAPDEGLRLPGCEAAAEEADLGVAIMDLDLALRRGESGLEGVVCYSTDLFDESTVERLTERYLRLLRAAAEDPFARLSALPLLTPGERRAVAEWGSPGTAPAGAPHASGLLLHELFAHRAARTPGAVAALDEGEPVSYAALDRRANRLAHHLRRRGVGPEARVGICLERSADMLAAILATLKAGGAYVPLDPTYPADRLAYLLEDSGARVLLAHADLAERFPAPGVEVVRPDGPVGEAGDDLAPAVEVSPDNLAYVIYTSGSTGTPKGVAVSHRAVANYAADMAVRLGLVPEDRILQFASPGFDVVVEELFPTWHAGAAVVLSREEMLLPSELLRVIERYGVTGLELPTAYWHQWVHELVREGLALPEPVRFLMVGGERILPERLAEWATLGVPLVHVFGLTETACTSTTLRLEAGDDGRRWSNLPVGRPTGGVRLYVLDRALQPVPPGVPGELFIGGEGVARGYLDRPGPTAERFVPDPFSTVPGARCYRTGDRVRWLADGNLEFLGRMDHQVKVRGFRIEPGEIEALLAGFPGVREAVVVAREELPGERCLVAYVVPTDAAGVSADELRGHLRARLPGYMVPTAFVTLDALPLNPHGKTDRRALPAPDLAAAADTYLAPRTPLEETLAEIWAEVLRTGRIGVEDDFFALGGHSLLVTRVASRARRALGVDFPLRLLFENATVAGQARALAGLEPPASPPAAETIASSEETEMRLLRDLDQLSDDDVERLLAELATDDLPAS